MRVEWQRSLAPGVDGVLEGGDSGSPTHASGSGMLGSATPSGSNLAGLEDAQITTHQNVMSFKNLQLTIGM